MQRGEFIPFTIFRKGIFHKNHENTYHEIENRVRYEKKECDHFDIFLRISRLSFTASVISLRALWYSTIAFWYLIQFSNNLFWSFDTFNIVSNGFIIILVQASNIIFFFFFFFKFGYERFEFSQTQHYHHKSH